MAFAVSIRLGNGGKISARFPTPQQALARAQEEEAHGVQDVTVVIAETSDEMTVQEFAAYVANSANPNASDQLTP